MAPNFERRQKIKRIEKKKLEQGVEAGPGSMSRKLAVFWKSQIEAVDEGQNKFIGRGNTIVRRYRDQRKRIDEEGQRRYNALWTNIQIMMPAVYSQPPTATVERKFLDRDVKSRLSSQMLERSLRNEQEPSNYHESIRMAVLDYLLPGRGQCWVRYEPEIGEGPSLPSEATTAVEDELIKILDEDENGGNDSDEDDDSRLDDEESDTLEESGDQILGEKCPVDYVDWRDFYMFPAKARTWAEVQAIGKRVNMSKHEACEFFGDDIGEELKPDKSPLGEFGNSAYSETSILQDINDRNVVVFEIWNKTDRRVYWVCTGYEYLCKVEDDPLKLSGFFPCPKPLMATTTNDSIHPVADYMEWQDQAIQIDELTQRIAMLSKSCKVAGTYDARNGGLKRLLSESVENELIPVDSWAAYSEAGGIPGSVSFLPLDVIIKVIETLTEVRKEVKQDLDEVTGLSDILRGTTDSRETLGGLRLKNNNAGTRLQDRQNQVAKFARDVLRIQAEIISKHFSDETIIESSGIKYEDELQPENVLDELKQSDQFQQMMQHLQQVSQQPPPGPPQAQLPGPQSPPQMGGNVVPLHPQQPMQGAPPGPPQGQQSPQGYLQSPQQSPQQDPDQLADMFLKRIVPQVIEKRIADSIELLRNDVPRRYRIDIETDSTIFGDAMQERQDATEFVTAFTQFMTAASEIGPTVPEAIPVMAKMMQWSVRKFRTGRDLESALDLFASQMEKKSKKILSGPPQPNPEVQKQQMELQKIQLQTQAQQQNDERDAQKQAAEDQRDQQMAQADAQREEAIESAKAQREKEKMHMEMQLDMMKMQLEEKKMGMEIHAKQQDHALKMHEAQTDLQLGQAEAHNQLQLGQMQHGQAMQQSQEKHNQSMQVSKEQHKMKLQQAKQPPAKKTAGKK